jgi:hypothetical protein
MRHPACFDPPINASEADRRRGIPFDLRINGSMLGEDATGS